MDYTDQSFKQGQEIKQIFWADGSVKAGSPIADKITVVMESGQMAGVHWFAVWKDGKVVNKYNGALVEGVELP